MEKYSMKISMQSTCLVLILILLHFSNTIAGDGTDETRLILMEYDSLTALKHAFNNPLLDENWVDFQCIVNYTTWHGIHCLNNRVTSIALEGMSLSGQIHARALANLTELTLISFKNNSISGNMMDFSANRKITSIDLSNNMFSGPISDSLLGLDLLESLQLHDNLLTGSIPPFNQSSLIAFNVSNNNLTGEIPQTSTLRSFDESCYLGNSGLCGPPNLEPCKIRDVKQQQEEEEKNNFFTSTSILIIFIVLDVIILIFLSMSILAFYRKTRRTEGVKEKTSEGDNIKDGGRSEDKAVVILEEQGKITFVDGEGGFHLDDLLKASAEGLGKGNFGSCYKVMVDDNRAIVVKRLRGLNPFGSEEFAKQIRGLANMKHPNLLPLLGYFYSKAEQLFIYNFAHNGNLFNRIHRGRGVDRIPFKWNSRLSIARGVARAMEFLHLNTKGPTAIPHGNLKSSNVLLSENDAVLVSDYGLHSLIPYPFAVQQMVSYKSPEYQYRRKISRKSDVWSYGCLLLELITGRASSFSAPEGIEGVNLCNWVHRAVREEWTAEVFDMEIMVQRTAAQGMFKLLQVALRCCEKSPDKRPEWGEVLREVESIKASNSDDDDIGDYSLEKSFTEESTSSNGSGGIVEER